MLFLLSLKAFNSSSWLLPGDASSIGAFEELLFPRLDQVR